MLFSDWKSLIPTGAISESVLAQLDGVAYQDSDGASARTAWFIQPGGEPGSGRVPPPGEAPSKGPSIGRFFPLLGTPRACADLEHRVRRLGRRGVEGTDTFLKLMETRSLPLFYSYNMIAKKLLMPKQEYKCWDMFK